VQNGPKTVTSTRKFKPAAPSANRSNWRTSSTVRPELKGSQNARRSYERYLALAQAAAQAGDLITAENYYQHSEHYFRSMSSERGTT
jgi:hypothetical protein